MLTRRHTVLIALAASLFLSRAAFADDNANWPQFRGPAASGISEGKSPPATWDVDKGENILWQSDIPGLGLSSPIIWGDKLIVTTAVRAKGEQPLKVGLYGDIASVNDKSAYEWHVICLDKKTGKILWDTTACTGVPKIKRHTKASHANSTPATDGKHVVAFFGSEGLYCFDMNGKELWKRDFGTLDSGYYEVPEAQWGFASSPIIHEDKVIIQSDVQKGSFVAALKLSDGSDLWMTQRKEVPTWCTPAISVTSSGTQVICNGYKTIAGYDISSGEEVWSFRGKNDIPVPTPIIAHDLIIFTSGHGNPSNVFAIKPSAKGKIKLAKDEKSNDAIAYRLDNRGTYMQTPLVYGDLLYCCMDNGIITCSEAKTGTEVYRKRLGSGLSGFTASPVASNGKLYFTGEDGDIYVVKAGREFEKPVKTSVGDVCMATPAISDGVLFVRTQKHIIAIGAANADSPRANSDSKNSDNPGSEKAAGSHAAAPLDKNALIKIAIEYLRKQHDQKLDSYDADVRMNNDEWWVTITRKPGMPGGHSTVVLDQNGHVLKVHPGA